MLKRFMKKKTSSKKEKSTQRSSKTFKVVKRSRKATTEKLTVIEKQPRQALKE